VSRRHGYIYDGLLRDVPDDPKPVLVVSADAVNRGMQAIVAQVTTTERRRTLPTLVVLEPGEGGVSSSGAGCSVMSSRPSTTRISPSGRAVR
jgi:mRNA-degrading endonuclease toxin of MazEF toxin-antitoxin module